MCVREKIVLRLLTTGGLHVKALGTRVVLSFDASMTSVHPQNVYLFLSGCTKYDGDALFNLLSIL